MYHDIGEEKSPWSVSPQAFYEQMKFLKENGYQTISLSQLKRGVDEGREIEDRKESDLKKMVITFDDARRGAYKYAFPVLQKFGFTACIYIVPEWIAGVNVPALEQYSGFCSWMQLKELADHGWELGSHSFAHKNLLQLDATSLAKDLDSAKKEIEFRTGHTARHFCYPFGKYNDEVAEAVLLRHETAVTVEKGFGKGSGHYARQWMMRETTLDTFSRLLRKPTISLCMIVKNEAQFLQGCLESAYSLVDEMIIVDTGSTDRTIDLAKIYTDKIYSLAWTDDFAAARNESLKHATGDWILLLDADEVLDSGSKRIIDEAINCWEIAGYQILTRNYTSDSAVSGWKPAEDATLSCGLPGWYPSLKVRLFQRKEGVKFEGAVHEMVEKTLTALNGKIQALPVVVHHYGELRPKEEKVRRNVLLTKKKVADNPQDAKAYCELGIQYKQLGQFAEAEEALRRSVELDPQPLTPLLNLAITVQKQGQYDEAMNLFWKVLQHDEKNSEAYFGLGFCYFQKQDLEKAKENFGLAAYYNPLFVEAYVNLGAIAEKQNKFTEAISYLKRALQLHPQHGRAYYNLGVAYERQGNLEMALVQYGEAKELGYKREEVQERMEKLTALGSVEF